jgi:hypothetical protein
VWIETWVERGSQSSATATLVSYAAFGDTMTRSRLGWFLRKSINGLDGNGEPAYSVASREESELRLRRANWDAEESQAHYDSLGAESVTIPLGTFKTTKVLRERGRAVTVDEGDSSIYYEQKIREISYMSRDVPITSLVKTDIDDAQRGKSWLIGKFTTDSLKILERAQGHTTLIGMGRGDVIPRLVPVKLRKPIADRKLIEAAMNQPMYPPTRILERGETLR